MLVSPVVVGVIAGGVSWVTVPLVLLWFVGYFWFNAVSLWLKARRRPKYFPPVRAYSIALVPLGLAVLALSPRLALFAPAFLPLVAFGLWMAARRKDRSLSSGLATVAAAAGFTYVVMAAAGPLDVRLATVLALGLFGYLAGTILYVKTMIRERNNPRYVVYSVGWHAAWTVAALVAGLWWVALVYAALTVRAWWFHRLPLTPKQVGMREMCFHLALVVSLLV